MYNCIIILGPTASGKTKLASNLALERNGAILSFDSRQVYKQLTVGSGKDLNEFSFDNYRVPHYLIDICDVKTNFHSYEFIKNFCTAYENCISQNLLPIMCGGTGLYFDLVLKKHQYINIPVNEDLREELNLLPESLLLVRLKSFPTEFTKHADTSTHKRRIRAIEIADYLSHNRHEKIEYPDLKPLIFGIKLSPEGRKSKIQERLKYRLENGLVEEIRELLRDGISAQRLIFLGLEYKYVTEYILGNYDKESMILKLETAIIQYAKRQMTWFRKMEKEGQVIHWIDGNLSLQDQLKFLFGYL